MNMKHYITTLLSCSRCELSESQLSVTVDDLRERLEETEARSASLASAERSLRAQLARREHTETDLNLKLENTKDDLQVRSIFFFKAKGIVMAKCDLNIVPGRLVSQSECTPRHLVYCLLVIQSESL